MLTDAVESVLGEEARGGTSVELDATTGRCRGRRPLTFGIREAALARPGGDETAARLVAVLTDAVASVLGEQARGGTSVELVATPPGRSGVGGAIAG